MLDLFAEPVPSFNLNGIKSFPSVVGGLVSITIIIVMGMYGSFKFLHFLLRSNPVIGEYKELDAISSEQRFNLRALNLPFAFTLEGFLDNETKDDTKYVKSFARMFSRQEGVETEMLIDFHQCTDEDFESFAEPTDDSKYLFQLYKNKERKLFCIDWNKHESDVEIWGAEHDKNMYQRFEWVLVPCNYVHAEIEPTGDFISPECIADREAQMDYLGNMRLTWMTTEQRFIQSTYDQSIKSSTRIHTRQSDNKKPSWFSGQLQVNVLEDEIDRLQYGQQDEHEFFGYNLGFAQASSWIYWPTEEEPSNRYKYVSIELNLNTS